MSKQIRGSQRFAALLLSREGVRRFVGHSDSRRYYPERGFAELWITAIQIFAQRYYPYCRVGSFQHGVLCRFVGHCDSRWYYYPERGFISASRFMGHSGVADSARQALASLSLEGVHFRSCFADSWVAESAHSVSRRYYPLIGRISWCSSQGPRKTHFLSVWGESSEGVACVDPFIGRPSSPEL